MNQENKNIIWINQLRFWWETHSQFYSKNTMQYKQKWVWSAAGNQKKRLGSTHPLCICSQEDTPYLKGFQTHGFLIKLLQTLLLYSHTNYSTHDEVLKNAFSLISTLSNFTDRQTYTQKIYFFSQVYRSHQGQKIRTKHCWLPGHCFPHRWYFIPFIGQMKNRIKICCKFSLSKKSLNYSRI